MEYYSVIKNEIMPFAATQMDLEIIIPSEVNQTKTNIIWYHLYMESKNSDTNELFYKTDTDSDAEYKFIIIKEEVGGGEG